MIFKKKKKLSDFTFKDFEGWMNERAADGKCGVFEFMALNEIRKQFASMKRKVRDEEFEAYKADNPDFMLTIQEISKR